MDCAVLLGGDQRVVHFHAHRYMAKAGQQHISSSVPARDRAAPAAPLIPHTPFLSPKQQYVAVRIALPEKGKCAQAKFVMSYYICKPKNRSASSLIMTAVAALRVTCSMGVCPGLDFFGGIRELHVLHRSQCIGQRCAGLAGRLAFGCAPSGYTDRRHPAVTMKAIKGQQPAQTALGNRPSHPAITHQHIGVSTAARSARLKQNACGLSAR